MPTFDEVKEQAGKAAGAVADTAYNLAEKASDWTSEPHPGADKAFDAVSGAAGGAVDKIADGANAAYEFIKNKAEEASGIDTDGDGEIGKTGAAPGEIKAGVEVAADAVAQAANNAVNAAKGMAERIAKKDLDGDGEIG